MKTTLASSILHSDFLNKIIGQTEEGVSQKGTHQKGALLSAPFLLECFLQYA